VGGGGVGVGYSLDSILGRWVSKSNRLKEYAYIWELLPLITPKLKSAKGPDGRGEAVTD
jgi:hypothetical protein